MPHLLPPAVAQLLCQQLPQSKHQSLAVLGRLEVLGEAADASSAMDFARSVGSAEGVPKKPKLYQYPCEDFNKFKLFRPRKA